MNPCGPTNPLCPVPRFPRLLAAVLGSFLIAPLVAEEAVFVTGYTVGSEKNPDMPLNGDQMEGMEDAADIGVSVALYRLGILPASPEYERINEAVEMFFTSDRPLDREIARQSFVIQYQSCMMRMDTPTQTMSIRLPPGQPLALMEMADRSTGEGFAVELNRTLDSAQAVAGSGWNSGMQMTPGGSGPELIGYDTEVYSFASSEGPGGGSSTESNGGPRGKGSNRSIPGAFVAVSNQGTAWVAAEADGVEIVRSFYDNFSKEVNAGQADDSFYGGMMDNMVGLLQHGLPLHIVQESQSTVAGTARKSSTSESWVNSVTLLERDDTECATTTIPDGFQVMAIGASKSDSGACDCSCEAFGRLQKMGAQGSSGSQDMDLSMASCMMKCTNEFMACAMNMNR